MDTPVPISNTEVKHFNGEDSVSENSKLPIFFLFILVPHGTFYFGVKSNLIKKYMLNSMEIIVFLCL